MGGCPASAGVENQLTPASSNPPKADAASASAAVNLDFMAYLQGARRGGSYPYRRRTPPPRLLASKVDTIQRPAPPPGAGRLSPHEQHSAEHDPARPQGDRAGRG